MSKAALAAVVAVAFLGACEKHHRAAVEPAPAAAPVAAPIYVEPMGTKTKW